jgi:hypothetical protein
VLDPRGLSSFGAGRALLNLLGNGELLMSPGADDGIGLICNGSNVGAHALVAEHIRIVRFNLQILSSGALALFATSASLRALVPRELCRQRGFLSKA